MKIIVIEFLGLQQLGKNESMDPSLYRSFALGHNTGEGMATRSSLNMEKS